MAGKALFHSLRDLVYLTKYRIYVAVWHKDMKIVGAYPADYGIFSKCLFQLVGHGLQHRISKLITKYSVYYLKIVYVCIYCGKPAA